jgi:hypothetical protein
MNNMSEFVVKKLILVSPLKYERDDSLRLPSGGGCEGGETLFRMALDPSQSRNFEPDRRAFPGRLAAAGKALPPKEAERQTGEPARLFELPAGTYLFTQVREPADTETLIDMIIEAQQEGLWERLSLDDRLYIRYLCEDGKTVTQVFRPVAGAASSA